MNKNKIFKEVAASLNREEADEEIVAQAGPDMSRLRHVHALLEQEKKTLGLLMQADSSRAWNRLKPERTKTRRLVRNITGYAACALLCFAAGQLLRLEPETEPLTKEPLTVFSVPNAEMGNMILADGTKVFLNSATTISYNPTPSRQREVFLSGEAYFEVKADLEHPFLVHLDDFTIKVTGTKFNARSYPHCNTEEASLIEGEITILNKIGDEVTRVKPNESLIFDKSSRAFTTDKENAVFKTAWRSGKIYLKNKTIEEIAATLERWYDVKFEFENEAIKQVRLTGTILKNKPIEQILEILKISEPVEFEYRYENQLISTVKIKPMP